MINETPMAKEDIIKEAILSKYGSILNFSKETGIPYSTIRNIFSRGFDGIGAGIAVTICRKLNLNIDALMNGDFSLLHHPIKENLWSEYVNSSRIERDLIDACRSLDEEGQKELLKYANLLISSGQFKKSSASASAG